jgi:CHAD domain-containing protein
VTIDEVIRSVLGRETANILRFDPIARRGDDPEGVHQLRVSARRLRSELRIVASGLKRQPLDQLTKDLRWLGRELGHQRDLDVLADLLDELCDEKPTLRQTSVLERLHRQQRDERFRVAKTLRSARYRDLVKRLSASVIDPPVRGSTGLTAPTVLMPLLMDALAQLVGVVDHMGSDPSNDDLHRVRIAVKQCRYNTDVASSFMGASALELARSLADVQTMLGTIHDRVVTISYLRDGWLTPARFGRGSDPVKPISDAIEGLNQSLETLKGHWRASFDIARVKIDGIITPH